MHLRGSIKKTLQSLTASVGLACTDFIALNASALMSAGLVYLLWDNFYAYIPRNEIASQLSMHILLSLVCILWFAIRLRHYTYRKPFWFELRETLRTIIIFAIIDLAIVAFSKWHLSRYVWVFTWSLAIVLLPLGRHGAKRLLIWLNLWNKPSIIFGTGRNAVEAYEAIKSEKRLGFDIQYFYATDEDHPVTLLGIPVIDSEAKLWEVTDPRNTQYFVALELDEDGNRELWIKKLATHSCRAVSVIPTTRGIPLNSTDMSFIFSHEILILRVHNNLTKLTSRILKRAFDIFAALGLTLLLSPVLIGLAVLIMRDGGSPIYDHVRIGRNGRKFKCYKFRSMILNSEQILDQLLATDPQARAEWERDFKLKDDPRITRIGNFIRRSSLDELPQLWNVLKGDMSMVGPRPVVEEELQRYAENVDYYLLAKPGITGLWQVSGRNDVAYETRVYFDAWYVKNWSLWNDIAILFKTANVVLKRVGAY